MPQAEWMRPGERWWRGTKQGLQEERIHFLGQVEMQRASRPGERWWSRPPPDRGTPERPSD